MPGKQNTQVSDLSGVEMGCSGPSRRHNLLIKGDPTGKELAPIASPYEVGMQGSCQPTLHLPTGVWQCAHLCENTDLGTCKIPRGFKIRRIILFMPLFLYSLPQVMVGTDLCNPASHLEQDCLQYQVMSAVTLAAQSLISAGGVDVFPFWVTCSSSGYPPSPIFFTISNLNLIIHSLWSLPLPANSKRRHHHNPPSNLG